MSGPVRIALVLAVLLATLTACGDGQPTTWQDIAWWAVLGATLVGLAFADRPRRPRS